MVRQASDSHAPVAGLDSSQQLLAPGMLVDAAAAAPAPGPALPEPANHSPQLVLDIANRHLTGDEEDEDDDEDEEDDIRSASPLEMSCRRSPTRDLTPPPAAASATAAASCLSAGPPPSAGAFGELLLDLPTELISNIVIFLPSPRLVAFAQCELLLRERARPIPLSAMPLPTCSSSPPPPIHQAASGCRPSASSSSSAAVANTAAGWWERDPDLDVDTAPNPLLLSQLLPFPSQPRRPRGDFVTTGSPWRLLYCSYLCKV